MEEANGNRQTLKPIIKKVIDGFILKFTQDEMDISIFNAEQVKEGCNKINPEINWNTRIRAICNCMRNYIKDGKGEVIGQDTDTNDFTILYNNSMKNNKSKFEKQKDGSYSFNLNGKEYKLFFEGISPRVYFNGVKQKAKTILIEYIKKEKLPIEIMRTTGQGNTVEKTTDQYGRSFQKYLGIDL